jgi:GT2 family glycosyltransferase
LRIVPVYLIHWSAPDWCRAAMDSLRRSRGVGVVITVVHNGGCSLEELRSKLEPDAAVLDTGANLGYAGGANVALDHWMSSGAADDLCVIGSHDLQVHPDALRLLVDEADRQPDFGVLGPRLTAPRKVLGGTWTGRGIWEVLADDKVASDSELIERDWVSGNCLLIRRECATSIGGFDQRFGSYLEDVDYCLRARDAGWKVGVLATARANGLGSISPDVNELVEVNTVLLRVKRMGLWGMARAFGWLGFQTIKTAMAQFAPWRSPERRKTSAAFLARHLRVWRQLGPARVWSFLARGAQQATT